MGYSYTTRRDVEDEKEHLLSRSIPGHWTIIEHIEHKVYGNPLQLLEAEGYHYWQFPKFNLKPQKHHVQLCSNRCLPNFLIRHGLY